MWEVWLREEEEEETRFECGPFGGVGVGLVLGGQRLPDCLVLAVPSDNLSLSGIQWHPVAQWGNVPLKLGTDRCQRHLIKHPSSALSASLLDAYRCVFSTKPSFQDAAFFVTVTMNDYAV